MVEECHCDRDIHLNMVRPSLVPFLPVLNHWCSYRYAFATLLSLYNKWMFSPQYYNFQYPLFVTACHMIVQFALAALIRIIWADKFRPKERPMRGDYL